MNSSFSMLFKPSYDETDQYHHQMVYPLGSPSSSVDCTLSLGTPSTRSGGGDQYDERRRGRSGSNFGCWDFLQGKSPSSSGSSGGGYNSHHSHKSGNSNNCGGGSNNVDPLLARRCANCDTTSTPLWRNGPRGPKSLCNACGIRFKKEERRATAATATATAPSGGFDSHYTYQNNSPWANNTPTTQKLPCFSPANEFRFIDDGDTGVPFLSWRLNVTDHRPTGLVHDFTR